VAAIDASYHHAPQPWQAAIGRQKVFTYKAFRPYRLSRFWHGFISMRRGFRIKPAPAISQRPEGNFRRRSRELEDRRTALIARLEGLGKSVRANPAYKCALNLINSRFHRTAVANRQAVLDAAKWSIDLLARLSAQR
jgi:hypothetical protein